MARIDPKTGKRRYAPLVGNRTVGPAPPPLAMEQRLKGEKHPPELRLKARAIYVYDKRPIIEAAQECGVSNVTVRRWKTQCLAAGDDWDMARQLTSLSSSNRGLLLNALLEDFLKQYRGTIAWLDKSGDELPALDRAHALSRLAAALEKVTDSHARLQPQQNKLAIAMDALRDFCAFVREREPGLAASLLNHLEPFGDYIGHHYAKGG